MVSRAFVWRKFRLPDLVQEDDVGARQVAVGEALVLCLPPSVFDRYRPKISVRRAELLIRYSKEEPSLEVHFRRRAMRFAYARSTQQEDTSPAMALSSANFTASSCLVEPPA